jgi:hypothetical protein
MLVIFPLSTFMAVLEIFDDEGVLKTRETSDHHDMDLRILCKCFLERGDGNVGGYTGCFT